MTAVSESVFLTQKGRLVRRAPKPTPVQDVFDFDIEEMAQGWAARESQSTLLLRKKREMQEVDDELEAMKTEYSARMQKCEARQRAFERRQLEMRDQVLRFEKFIQENDGKRSRADAKARAEHKVLEAKEQELAQLQAELRAALAQEQQLCAQRERLRRYLDYLAAAASTSEQHFEEVADLLARFRTLEEANEQLQSLCQERDRAIEKGRIDLEQLRRDRHNELLVRNSQWNERQRDLEQARNGVARASNEAENEVERVNLVAREYGQVVSAIKNLGSRCQQTARGRPGGGNGWSWGAEKGTERQNLDRCLTLVMERIQDLGEIESGYPQHGEGHMSSGPSVTTLVATS
ncbi:unnamed protein product [Phaeothamnion confervicola]